MKRELLQDIFEEVETTTEYNGYYYSIPEAISIVALGSICRLRNVSQIHQWAESGRTSEFLKGKFGVERIPCYYWLLILLKKVKPDSLNKCLIEWVKTMFPPEREGLTLALDGKTVRPIKKMKDYTHPRHIVSARLSELGITFGSKSVSGKSNEIPAVQELLAELDIAGCLVVADALNCQRETAKAIIEGRADYLLIVKANRPALMQDIVDYVQDDSLCVEMETQAIQRKIVKEWKNAQHLSWVTLIG